MKRLAARKAITVGLVMTLFLIGGAVSASAATRHTKVFPGTINVSWLGNGSANALPVSLAKDDGIFAKYGINANVEVIAQAVTVAAFDSGAVQFSEQGAPQFELAYEEGVPIKLLGTYAEHEDLYLIVGPGITSAKGLIGKPMVDTSQTALTTVLEQYYLHLNQIPYKSVSWVPTSNINQFISGEVDATVGSILNVHLAEQGRPGSSALYNYNRLIWPAGEIWGYAPWTSTHAAETAAFLKAINASLVAWNSDPSLAEHEIQTYNPTVSPTTVDIDYGSTEQVFNKGAVPLHVPSYKIESFINKALRLVGVSTAANSYARENKVWTSRYWNMAFGKTA